MRTMNYCEKHCVKKNRVLLMAAAVMAICMAGAVMLTGCGTQQQAAQPEETTQAVTEATTQAVTEATAATEEAQPTEAPEQSDTQAAQQEIGEEQALNIALEDAGFSASDVSFSNVHLDYDDGRTEYEVDFHQGTMEYDYTIDAYTGDILEKESESIND